MLYKEKLIYKIGTSLLSRKCYDKNKLKARNVSLWVSFCLINFFFLTVLTDLWTIGDIFRQMRVKKIKFVCEMCGLLWSIFKIPRKILQGSTLMRYSHLWGITN